MKTRRRLLLCFVLIVLLAIGGTGLGQARQQYTRNRQLIAAMKKDDTTQALALLKSGANPNTRLNPSLQPSLPELHQPLPAEDGPTAFMMACGGDIGTRPADYYRGPPKHRDHIALVRAMFRHGANVNARASDKLSALHIAAATNQPRVVKWLLEHHADVNAQNVEGKTSLMEAATCGASKTTRLLLKHGAKVNLQDNNGNASLFYAVTGYPNADVVRQLLAHGADPNLRNEDGDTPLTLAREMKRPDLVALLQKGGK